MFPVDHACANWRGMAHETMGRIFCVIHPDALVD
jgi:hypothetical protein